MSSNPFHFNAILVQSFKTQKNLQCTNTIFIYETIVKHCVAANGKVWKLEAVKKVLCLENAIVLKNP